MSERAEKLQRKEARRILGERSTSVVGQVRAAVLDLSDILEHTTADHAARLAGLERGQVVDRERQRDDVARLVCAIGDLTAKLAVLSQYVDAMAAATTARARLVWLLTGRWPGARA